MILQPVRLEGHLAVLLRHLGILGKQMVHQEGGLSPKDLPLRSLVSGDAIVQDCSTILQAVRPEGHLAVLPRRLGILGEPMIHQKGELSPKDLFLRSQDSSRQDFFLSRGPIQVRSVKPLSPCCTHEAITLSRETC